MPDKIYRCPFCGTISSLLDCCDEMRHELQTAQPEEQHDEAYIDEE